MCRAGQDRLVKEGVEWCLQQLFLSEVSQFLLNKEPSFTVLLLKQVWGGSSPGRVYFKRNDSVFSSWVFKTDWPASHNILQMWIQSLTEWKHLQVSMELVLTTILEASSCLKELRNSLRIKSSRETWQLLCLTLLAARCSRQRKGSQRSHLCSENWSRLVHSPSAWFSVRVGGGFQH